MSQPSTAASSTQGSPITQPSSSTHVSPITRPSSSVQVSPADRLPKVNVTPVNLNNVKPQQPSPPTSQNLCLIPSPSTPTIARLLTNPIVVTSTAPPPVLTSTTKTSRKRKEEPPSANIDYSKDILCYECGDFFTDETQFEEHKSCHSFTRIALRMHIEQLRKDVEVPVFGAPLDPEEEKEYIRLRSEQVGKKKESGNESHNNALNPGLHHNHNFAINGTLLDKRPAVKVYNLKTRQRITNDRLEPEPKMRKCYFTGDFDNPIGYDDSISMKEYMQKRLAEVKKKPKVFTPGEVITLED